MIRRAFPILFAAACAFAAFPAAAQDWENWLQGGTLLLGGGGDGPWRGNLALGLGAAPAFPGSVGGEPKLLPLVDLEWRDRIFLSTQRGVGFNWVRGFGTKAGPRLTIDWGRSPSDDTDLAGTPTVKRTIEAGLFFVNYRGPWRVHGDVRVGVIGGHKSLRGNFGAAVGTRISDSTSLIFGGTLRFDGAKYNVAYYSDDRSSFSEVAARVDVVREFGDGNYLAGSASVGMFNGPAKDAAYTATGSFFAGLLLGHRF